MRFGDAIRRATDIGPRAISFRAIWEVKNRSGLRELLEPVGVAPTPGELPTFAEWSRGWPADHLLRGIRERSRAGVFMRFTDDALLARAAAATQGRITLFGHHEVEIGSPPDFHLEPLSGGRWPPLHWSRVLLDARAGDPRTTWEVNRFRFVWDWIRAYARDGDERWPCAFAGLLEEWERQNPYRQGINWASGQELAVRALTWCFGAAVFGDRPGFEESDFRRLWRLVYAHGAHIETELDFARLSVPNNHLLAEALALAILGELGANDRRARRWRGRGLEVFREGVAAQFREDGGYCQNSHRYHRYALELVVLADRWFPELRDVTEPVLAAGFDYFSTMVVAPHLGPNRGTVPNYGPNDGAAMFGLTACADDDIRPLLATLASRTTGRCGPPDFAPYEQPTWLYGRIATTAESQPVSRSFPVSGIHVMRHEDWAVFMRCGAASRRSGHSDQLHLDVWRDGESLAIDAGSARYFDREHPWHAGTMSHNTVTLDGRGQQELAGRFTWLRDAAARIVEFDAARSRIVGRCDAWLEQGILHDRDVAIDDDVVVTDTLSPTDARRSPHIFRLHWLIPCAATAVRVTGQECFTWNIETPHGAFEIVAEPLAPEAFEAELSVEEASHAPAYGARVPATSLVVVARGLTVKFVTRIAARR